MPAKSDSTLDWSPRCTICKHEQSDVIDHHLITQDLSVAKISKIFGLSISAIGRHKKNCIRAKAKVSRKILEGAAATRQAATTIGRTDEIFEAAKPLLDSRVKEGDVEGAARIIASLHDNVRLRGELTKELVTPGQGGQGMGGDGIGGNGSRVQVIMMPTIAGKSPDEVAAMISAPTLNLEAIRAQEDED